MDENEPRNTLLKIVNISNKWFTGPFYVCSTIKNHGCCWVTQHLRCQQVDINDFESNIELNDNAAMIKYEIKKAFALKGSYKVQRECSHYLALRTMAVNSKAKFPLLYKFVKDSEDGKLVHVWARGPYVDMEYTFLNSHEPLKHESTRELTRELETFDVTTSRHRIYMTQMLLSEINKLYESVKTENDPSLLLKSPF